MARTRLEASVDARAQKLNFEATARRLVATNVPDALRCATDIRERIVSFTSCFLPILSAGNCTYL